MTREQTVLFLQAPVWLVRPPEVIVDQKVLIVNHICSEGLTLTVAEEATRVQRSGTRA